MSTWHVRKAACEFYFRPWPGRDVYKISPWSTKALYCTGNGLCYCGRPLLGCSWLSLSGTASFQREKERVGKEKVLSSISSSGGTRVICGIQCSSCDFQLFFVFCLGFHRGATHFAGRFYWSHLFGRGQVAWFGGRWKFAMGVVLSFYDVQLEI